jgi:hypothetical protein
MVNRRWSVQEAHERFNVGLFLEIFNHRYHSDFAVVEEPNPPEAIIRSGHTTRWVEVTTAFWNRAFAIDVNSYATEGEVHRPIGDGVFVGPDVEFAGNFVSVIRRKLEKATYAKFRDRYGPGYLVVSVQYPLFSERTMHYIRKAWSSVTLNDQGSFRSIYVAYRVFNGHRVVLWRYRYRPPTLQSTAPARKAAQRP